MRIMSAAVVCLLTLYAVDASYCGGKYFAAFNEVVHFAAR
jgi:hypothetical protein